MSHFTVEIHVLTTFMSANSLKSPSIRHMEKSAAWETSWNAEKNAKHYTNPAVFVLWGQILRWFPQTETLTSRPCFYVGERVKAASCWKSTRRLAQTLRVTAPAVKRTLSKKGNENTNLVLEPSHANKQEWTSEAWLSLLSPHRWCPNIVRRSSVAAQPLGTVTLPVLQPIIVIISN